MMSNKNDARHNIRNKGDNIIQGTKKTPIVSHPTSRMKTFNKAKLEPTTLAQTPNNARKLHNCLPPQTLSGFKKPPSSLNRKSISLVELTCNSKVWTLKKWQSKEHGDEVKSRSLLESKSITIYPTNVDELNLAKKVCKMFILHAWRQRRAQAAALQTKAQKLETEVENLNIQIVVLRNLLESEKLRVAVAMSDSAHLRTRLENEIKTTKDLRKDVSQFKNEKSMWEKLHSQMDSEIKSLKSELTVANGKIGDLEEECDNCRKSLSNSRDKESELQSKLGVAEACLRDKISHLQDVQKQSTNYKAQLTELISKAKDLCKEKENKDKDLHECLVKITKKDGELNNLQNIRNVQHENITNLTKDVAVASRKIEEQNKVIKKLHTVIEDLNGCLKTHESEKEEFESNLLKVRNRVVFEAIKISASLLFPLPAYVV